MLTYNSATGEILLDGIHDGYGYSGRDEGRNNPDMESVQGVGPIPRGRYRIGPPHFSDHTGPLTFNLDPVGHNACGRTALKLHGDNKNHDASEGCLIAGRSIRESIAENGETALEVI